MGETIVYVDANLFISAVNDKNKTGGNARIIVNNIEKGKYRAISSTLTIDEVLWVLTKLKDKKTAIEIAKTINSMSNLDLIEFDKEVLIKMFEIYESENLRPRDSAHLATMKLKNVSTIISLDKDFDKIKGIKRVDFSK